MAYDRHSFFVVVVTVSMCVIVNLLLVACSGSAARLPGLKLEVQPLEVAPVVVSPMIGLPMAKPVQSSDGPNGS